MFDVHVSLKAVFPIGKNYCLRGIGGKLNYWENYCLVYSIRFILRHLIKQYRLFCSKTKEVLIYCSFCTDFLKPLLFSKRVKIKPISDEVRRVNGGGGVLEGLNTPLPRLFVCFCSLSACQRVSQSSSLSLSPPILPLSCWFSFLFFSLTISASLSILLTIFFATACTLYLHVDIIYRISRPNSRVFHSNSFSLHSNSTILVHCRISAVQIHYSGFQIYGFFIRINIFFIQIHWNSAIFTILSFNLALYGLVTS